MRRAARIVLGVVAAVAVVAAGMTASVAAPSAYAVTITTSETTTEAEDFITVSGAVTGPGAAGTSVRIQRAYVGGSFRTVATARISSAGRYSARVETPRGGTTSFRVAKAASGKRAAGTSRTRKVRVFEWLYLSQQPETPIFRTNTSISFVSELGGRTFRHSVGIPTEHFGVSYRLDGQCTKFAGRIGVDDRSADDGTIEVLTGTYTNFFDASATTVVFAKEKLRATDFSAVNRSVKGNFLSMGTGEIQPDVSGDPDPEMMASFGDARVYCNLTALPTGGS